MKAQELRVGNYTDKGRVISFYEQGIHVGNGKCFIYNDLQPILLTEEILLKCGFDNTNNILFRNESIDLIFNLYFEYIWIYDKELKDCICVKCSYLHNLQNLYFALTGEELEINL